MYMEIKRVILLISMAGSLLASCSTTKRLPPGDALYVGSSVRVQDSARSSKEKKAIAGSVSGLTRPHPNKKILGIPFKLMMYNLAGNPKKQKSPAGWLKNKVGEPPVLLSSVNLSHNEKVLQSTLYRP